MLLTLPSGQTVNIPYSTVAAGSSATAGYPPVIGNDGLMGVQSGGNFSPFVNQTYGTLLVYSPTGALQATSKLNNSAAVTTALAQIAGALAGGCAAGTLAANGNLTWAAPAS